MKSEVYNEDCMIGMARYPDKYFELAIVDPPYGIGLGSKTCIYDGKVHGNAKAKRSIHTATMWDLQKPQALYFKELMRISVNQIIWGANHFISKIPFDSPCWIVWDKNNGDNDFADGELAWCSFNSAVRFFKYTWNGMLQSDMKNKESRIHPTQKPIALYKWLLRNYAKPGDKILDTHLGSGSSRIACYDGGFDFTGFELDKDYFDAAEQRFQNHIKQLSLF